MRKRKEEEDCLREVGARGQEGTRKGIRVEEKGEDDGEGRETGWVLKRIEGRVSRETVRFVGNGFDELLPIPIRRIRRRRALRPAATVTRTRAHVTLGVRQRATLLDRDASPLTIPRAARQRSFGACATSLF